MKLFRHISAVIFLIFPSLGSSPAIPTDILSGFQNDTLLIDDFSVERKASFGTEWRMFTDRVMGGLSDASSRYETLDGRRCLRLQGSVSLENNGGFVQVALPLIRSRNPFDASDFSGVRISIKGNKEKYHIHLRTAMNRRPWQYYGASFDTTGEWQTQDISFSSFRPENHDTPLDLSRLQRIAVVAIKKAFQADIAIARMEFYR